MNEPDSTGGKEMPAEFGQAMATFIVLASMVGAGILTTSGYTVASVGSNQWMLILWVVGGITAICGALTLAELSAAMPRTGGDYVYLYEAYGPLPAFLSGWVSFLIGFSGPSAAAARSMAKYMLAPLAINPGSLDLWERVVATAGVLIFAAIHVSGRSQTSRVQTWVTLLKLALLLLLAGAGLVAGRSNLANLDDLTPLDGTLTVTLLSSSIFIYYSYTGWNAAAYLAGEVRDPQRTLPRAVLLGTGGVMVLYLALNIVYAMALSAADIRAIVKKDGFDAVSPIAQIASSRLFGSRWSMPLSFSIGLMLLSSLSAYLLIGPRVLYAMAVAGQFPRVAARLTSRANTPGLATLFQVVVALVLLWMASLREIIQYAGVGLSIFSMLAMSAIYVLRVKRPDLARPFRTPGYPVTPAIYLLLTALITMAAFQRDPWPSSKALLSILAGIPVYYLWQYAGRRAGRTVVSSADR